MNEYEEFYGEPLKVITNRETTENMLADKRETVYGMCDKEIGNLLILKKVAINSSPSATTRGLRPSKSVCIKKDTIEQIIILDKPLF